MEPDIPLYEDALGVSIHPGQVAAHISRKSSNVYVDPVIIRELLPDNEILVDRISDRYEGDWPNWKRVYFLKRVKLLVPGHLIVVTQTEADLLAKYKITNDEEGKADAATRA